MSIQEKKLKKYSILLNLSRNKGILTTKRKKKKKTTEVQKGKLQGENKMFLGKKKAFHRTPSQRKGKHSNTSFLF